MSEDDDSRDLQGNRESPMSYNGGLRQGPSRPPLEWRDYQDRSPSKRVMSWEHPRSDRTHPPLFCPAPRISEPLRGFRCPACARRMHHDGHESPRDFGYRVTGQLGAALADATGRLRDMPHWAEKLTGVLLVAGGLLSWLALQGWIPR